MSPPIRDGSGSSIGSIRLGDGSEISEVRTGAGDVLFSGSAIPDTGKEYNIYDVRDVSGSDGDNISSLNDQERGDDLTGNATLRTNGANGKQYLELSTSQTMDVSFSSAISQPFEYMIVAKLRDNNNNYGIIDGDARNEGYISTFDSSWEIFADGTGATGGTEDTDLHIFNAYFDTDNSNFELLIDNNSVITDDDNGSASRGGHTVGALGDGARNAPLDKYYSVFFNDMLVSSERQNWFDYLFSIYG